jgi:pyruvate dehydrogenase (quinone)
VVDFPYARYAEMLGLAAVRVDKPEQIGPAWDMALDTDRPCLIEAITDPEVPPLPPHITLKQAKAFAASMWKGDSERESMLRQAMREAKATVFHGGGD